MKEPNLEVEIPEWIKVVKEVLRDGGRAIKKKNQGLGQTLKTSTIHNRI